MCSIVGMVSSKHDQSELVALTKGTLKELKNRGPDSWGIAPFSNSGSIGMNRLRIIGAENIEIPMQSLKKDITLAFNGEIYNYKKIRDDLEKNGMVFRTDTDIEVVLNGYIHYGLDLFEKLNGIFAIAIVDEPRSKVLLVRDRFGAKPLYYYHDGKVFVFCSDFIATSDVSVALTGEKLNISKKGLTAHTLLRFCPDNHTIFREVKKVRPGEIGEFDLFTGCLELRYYWKPEVRLNDFSQKRFNETLWTCFDRVKTADIPVSLLLSGGLDSASLLAYFSNGNPKLNLNTFSCSFSKSAKQAAGTELPIFELVENIRNFSNISAQDEKEYIDFVSDHFRTEHKHFQLPLHIDQSTFDDMKWP